MAIGGRGIISVCSNEMPARDGADGRGRRARRLRRGARACTSALLPLMQVNFCESSPGPVKFAMAAMGLCEEVFRLPMVPPRPGVAREGAGGDARARPADRRPRAGAREGAVAHDAAGDVIEALVRRRGAAPTRPRRARRSASCASGSAPATCAPPSPTRRRRRAGASTPGSSRASCSASASATSRDMSMRRLAVLRQGHDAAEAAGRARRRAHRARRIVGARRRVPRPRA